mmetsp:Transcript_21164/g.71661  ORF Transcript_21164/g.71661 Transcript_21164/m.71661 type:complete len:264 (-) Transcript_21164:56-847(-)
MAAKSLCEASPSQSSPSSASKSKSPTRAKAQAVFERSWALHRGTNGRSRTASLLKKRGLATFCLAYAQARIARSIGCSKTQTSQPLATSWKRACDATVVRDAWPKAQRSIAISPGFNLASFCRSRTKVSATASSTSAAPPSAHRAFAKAHDNKTKDSAWKSAMSCKAFVCTTSKSPGASNRTTAQAQTKSAASCAFNSSIRFVACADRTLKVRWSTGPLRGGRQAPVFAKAQATLAKPWPFNKRSFAPGRVIRRRRFKSGDGD